MKDIAGRVVLITGTARGMGKLHARNFAREGCRVVITDVDQAELEHTASELRDTEHEVFRDLTPLPITSDQHFGRGVGSKA